MKGFHQIDNRCKKNNMTYFTNDKNGTVKGLVQQTGRRGRCTPSKGKKGDDEVNDEDNDENNDENSDENDDEDNGDDGEEDEKDEEENKEDDGEEGNGAG